MSEELNWRAGEGEGGRWEVAQEKFWLTYWVIAALYFQAQVVSPGKTLPQDEVEGQICSQRGNSTSIGLS